MAGRTGTHDISFLLASTNPITGGTLSFDDIASSLDADTAAYAEIVRQQTMELAEFTTERFLAFGGSASGSFMEVDEYGQAPTQRAGAASQVGLPLRKFQNPVGWTREWEEEKSAADFARSTQGVQQAYYQRVTAEFKKAIYISANYTFVDHLVDNQSIGVKRFLNADGISIPNGPNGEAFDGSTHTHYLATASLTTTGADALISTIVEHGHGSAIRIYISQANETAWRALTGFTAYIDPNFVLGNSSNQLGQRLDITRMNNRAIGRYGAAEVWVKPWAITNYAFAFDVGSQAKPLAVRERRAGSFAPRRIADNDLHPLIVAFWESKYGIGVRTRTNGAVWYHASGTYADPTITNP